MKFLFLFFFASFLLVDFLSMASPALLAQDLPEQNLPAQTLDDAVNIGTPSIETLTRHKRATCPWFPGACDIHCRSKGFSTGFCRGGTCTCKNH